MLLMNSLLYPNFSFQHFSIIDQNGSTTKNTSSLFSYEAANSTDFYVSRQPAQSRSFKMTIPMNINDLNHFEVKFIDDSYLAAKIQLSLDMYD
jgi:hypothetical protein